MRHMLHNVEGVPFRPCFCLYSSCYLYVHVLVYDEDYIMIPAKWCYLLQREWSRYGEWLVVAQCHKFEICREFLCHVEMNHLGDGAFFCIMIYSNALLIAVVHLSFLIILFAPSGIFTTVVYYLYMSHEIIMFRLLYHTLSPIDTRQGTKGSVTLLVKITACISIAKLRWAVICCPTYKCWEWPQLHHV